MTRGCVRTFVERIFAYRRLTAVFAARWSMGDVVRFHTAHKLTLMAHRPEVYQRLGVPYLADQVYLRPHPVELMLRNHV